MRFEGKRRGAASVLIIGLLATATLAGCGTSDTSSSTTPTTLASSAGAVTKVSANTASQAELTAALTAAGVSNPSRWAKEIEEYRPYEGSDPQLTKLQQNLAKYNPGDETLRRILSALEP